MTSLSQPSTPSLDAYAARRTVALANVRWFRSLAWRALRDGLPMAEMRAANARQAARIVLAGAKREAKVYYQFRDVLNPTTEIQLKG